VSYQTDSALWNFRFNDNVTANPITTSSANTQLWLSGPGALYMVAGGGISSSFGVVLSASAASWASVSDERVKDIIEPIENAIDKIVTLRTVIGKYKTDDVGIRRSFLIAQDVQKVLPEAVTVGYTQDAVDPENPSKVLNTTECLNLSYTDTIPLLVAAIKEQQILIETLTTRIATLEAK
jgi:hypothetical protein